jgi:putative transcriptional regulator
MDSSRARFARLGPVRQIDRVISGSPAVFAIRLAPGAPRTIDATFTLARRGISMLKAKRAIEAALGSETVCVALPCVEDVTVVIGELQSAGFTTAEISPDTPDVRALRTRLDMTREQFAQRYGLEIETVRNWEIGKREPDRTARSYLQAIANRPEQVAHAYGFAEESHAFPPPPTNDAPS